MNDRAKADAGLPLFKDAKGTRKVERIERQAETDHIRSRTERHEALKRAAEIRATRRALFERDKSRCRCCGREVAWEHYNPNAVGHWHHLIYKSAGGDDSLDNALLLCWRCHRLEHDHRYRIVGTGQSVTITEKNLTTGKVIREWESKL